MKTFSITTLGCKVNQYEGQQLRQLLEQTGLRQVNPAEAPELAVINTCCITHSASAKSRQCVRKIQKQSPDTTIVIAGCLPVAAINELKNISGNIHIVRRKNEISNVMIALIRAKARQHNMSSNKTDVVTYNSKPQNGAKIKHKTRISPTKTVLCRPRANGAIRLSTLTAYKGQHRAFLKVQDGCDGFCSYCIIPQIRTDVCNKNVKTVLSEAKALVEAGHKEIVLCGIFLGAYGQNTVRRKKRDPKRRQSLAKLVEKVARIEHLERLRLSSLEPADVTEPLLEVYSKYPKVMPHLHLPLQSGSQRILKKMGRQYSIQEYMRVVERARKRLDRPAITTDIIVGFPSETEQNFQMSLDIAQKIGFSKIHVFSFSARSGTAAARMQAQIKPEVIKKRSQRLRTLDKRLQAEFRQQFIGERLGIIIEAMDPPRGRCERYFMVNADELKGIKNPKLGQLVFGTFQPDRISKIPPAKTQ
jgi:threonylcarbamoyladenosine tRNA methylthiotransferase MtaB